jgi:hypothetical protein
MVMHSEVQVLDSSPSVSNTSIVDPLRRRIAVSDMKSDRMVDLMQVPTLDQLRETMRTLGVPNVPELRNADLAIQIGALAKLDEAYLPLREVLIFISTLLAKVREVYRAKQFGGEEFRLYFHSCAELMTGQGRLRPLPACLATITGTGFALTGPSRMGRTATLQRLIGILGKPFLVQGEHPAPRQMWVMPILHLPYPTCGTLRGLLRDLRERVLASIGRYDMNVNALSDVEGSNGENAAIALCTLLNVGLVVLDGGGFVNVNGKTQHIFQFLLKLRQFTGIPVLISGTSAFMCSTSYMGNLASNIFNGPTLHLDPLKAPTQQSDATSNAKSNPGVWHQLNAWLWSQGLHDESCKMPEELSKWTYQSAFGRLGWLVQGFQSLHIALITSPDLQKPGALTEERVLRIFDLALQLHNSARRVVASPSSKGKAAFLKVRCTVNNGHVRFKQPAPVF